MIKSDYFEGVEYDEDSDHWQAEIGSFAIHGRDEETPPSWSKCRKLASVMFALVIVMLANFNLLMILHWFYQ